MAGLMRSSLHRIEKNLNRELETIENVIAYIGTMDENGSMKREREKWLYITSIYNQGKREAIKKVE